jgi:mycofactocin system glycosyltransferase
VVVPVRDRPADLERLLDALDSSLACIVVDDASTDAAATKEIATRHGARFVGLGTNLGPSGARNAGLSAAHSPLIAFVDSDCEPTPGWLDPLLAYFDDPLVGAVAPRIVAASPSGVHGAAARYLAVRSSLDLGSDEGLVRRGGPLPFVPSAALIVRAQVCTTADLFDPALRGGEDVDLVWRLDDAGWDVWYVPSSIVQHRGPDSFADHLERRSFYGATAGPLALRHPGSLAPMSASAWSVAVWALAAARLPGSALAVQGASIALLAQRLRGLVRRPVVMATRIAGGGTMRSSLPALAGLARAWSPALVVALAFRRTRRTAALALLVPALQDWRRQRDRLGLDPVRYTALHVADDVAYGSGVWAGCAQARTLEPLVPRLVWSSRVWSARSLRRNLSPGAAAEGRSRGSGKDA